MGPFHFRESLRLRYCFVGMLLIPMIGGCEKPAAKLPEMQSSATATNSSTQLNSPSNSQSTTDSLPEKSRSAQNNWRSLTDQQSHSKMLETLQKYRDEGSVSDPFLGSGRLLSAQKFLETIPVRPPTPFRLEGICRVAEQELNMGKIADAISSMQNAIEMLDQIQDRVPAEKRLKVLQQAAVTYLRQAETENCIHCRTGESCILPIQPGGVHNNKSGSTAAIAILDRTLKEFPDDVVSKWLLNVAHMTLGGYPDQVPSQHRIDPAKFQSAVSFPKFENAAAELGIDTLSLSGGAIGEDFNGDNHIDLMVSDWNLDGQLRLFLNDGDGTFTDNTTQANLQGLFGGLNLVQADFDNDGDVDVLVLRGAWKAEGGQHANSLLRNDGQGVFLDITYQAGLADVNYPTQTAAWSDFDNDGDLDLCIGNENSPLQLFVNDGQGRFSDIARQAGLAQSEYTKAVAWGDYDSDGFPDLYLSNYYAPNRLYHNNRDGTFTDVTSQLNVAGPQNGFAAWFWDYDNDGHLDLYASSYSMSVEDVAAQFFDLRPKGEPDFLFRNQGDGTFREVAAQAGVTRVSDPMGSNFGDLNNDGFLDFYLGTGYPPLEALEPNIMYLNQNGTHFVDVTFAGGFGHIQKGHAVVFADFDGDGDIDIFQQMGGAYPVDAFSDCYYRNPGFGNHYLFISLKGVISNRFGVGARIRVDITENGEDRSIYRWVNSGGSFGCNPLRQHFGLGAATKIRQVEVWWPTSKTTQIVRELPLDRHVEITEGVDSPAIQ